MWHHRLTIPVNSQSEREAAQRTLPERLVEVRTHDLVDPVVLHVPRDADDSHPSRVVTDLRSERDLRIFQLGGGAEELVSQDFEIDADDGGYFVTLTIEHLELVELAVGEITLR